MIEAPAERAAIDVSFHSRAPLIALGALLLLAIAVYWPSITALADLWSHSERRTYQHGYPLAAISLWLIYRERRPIAAAAGRRAAVLAFVAAGVSVAWAIAWNAGLQVAHILLWPIAFWAAAAGMLGLRAGRVLLWPVAFFYFALPVWDALNPLLQSATVHANQALATLLGVPVIIEDTLIHIPEGSFEIAGGCSGLNYLVVGLAVAALLGELNGDSPRRRLYLMALSGGLAVVSNWVRVFIIIYAGHVSNMTHYLVRVDHYKWGWVLYAFVLALFFYVARRMPPSTSSVDGETAVAGVQWHARAAPIVAACAAVALGPVLAGWRHAIGAGHAQAQAELSRLPAAGNGSQWQASPAVGGWLPQFPGADAEQLMDYSHGDARVAVYTATYLRQSQGRELVGHDSRIEGRHPGRLMPVAGPVALTEPEIAMAEGEWRDSYGGRAMFWWIYQVGTRQFTSGLHAQLWYGTSSLWSAPLSSIVVLRSECLPDCDHARRILGDFAGDTLTALLETTGGEMVPAR